MEGRLKPARDAEIRDLLREAEIQPGMRVLVLASGPGAPACRLAREAGCHVEPARRLPGRSRRGPFDALLAGSGFGGAPLGRAIAAAHALLRPGGVLAALVPEDPRRALDDYFVALGEGGFFRGHAWTQAGRVGIIAHREEAGTEVREDPDDLARG